MITEEVKRKVAREVAADVELSIIEFTFRGDPNARLSVIVDRYVHRDESNKHAAEKIPKSERVHTGTRESKKAGQ